MPTRILAVSTVLLAALLYHEYTRTAALREQLALTQATAATASRDALIDSLSGRGPEYERAIEWLDSYYRSAEGLQRPNGLWVDGHPDYQAIGVWIFDVYQAHRLKGETEEQARQAVVDAIHQTDEWRGKHRT